MQAVFEGFCFRQRGRGALRSPTPLGRWGAKGFTSSRALPGLFWWEFWFPTMRAALMMVFPMVRAWGALLPYTPSGTGCERAAPLSRSPGGCSFEGLVSDDAGYSFERFCFRRRGAWGAPLPYIPSGDGVREGSHPLALSRRVFGWGDFGFDGDGMVFYGGREKRRRVGGVCVRA